MTRLETQVLDLLREDCSLPLEKLAVMLGVSTEEVAETIDSLERRRVILHYAPTINWDLTDRERVEAMIQVSVTPPAVPPNRDYAPSESRCTRPI